MRMRGIFSVVVGLAAAGPAFAWSGTVDWPTYLRTGPGDRFVVIDELFRGTAMEVQGCADQWCQVRIGRTEGYVAQANIAAPVGAAPVVAAPAPGVAPACFDSTRAGYGAGEVLRYCPK